LTNSETELRLQEAALRDEIVHACQLLHQKGFIAATDGNISARLDANRLLVTPSGVGKGFIKPGDLIITDFAGSVLDPGALGAKGRPSAELRLHLEAYRQRPDVAAVVHAHPPLATACTIAGISLETCVIPEVVVTLGTIPTVPYATPTSAEGPERVREYIRTRDALLLDHHGAVTVGKSVMEAYLRLEKVEHAAQMILIARQLGKVIALDAEQMEKLMAIRREHGLWQPGDEEAFRRACGA
jgi:L-fuculose-phosphate aldolase